MVGVNWKTHYWGMEKLETYTSLHARTYTTSSEASRYYACGILPYKRINLTKGITFYQLPMDILTNIDTWTIDLKYNDKNMAIISRITIMVRSVL